MFLLMDYLFQIVLKFYITFKNIEKEVQGIHSKTVHFICEKLGRFERGRTEKEKNINVLHIILNDMSATVESLEGTLD